MGYPVQLQRLAAEVVELEEKALKARSEELKREREAAAEREAAKRAQAAATAALQERETLQSILDTLEVPYPTLRPLWRIHWCTLMGSDTKKAWKALHLLHG